MMRRSAAGSLLLAVSLALALAACTVSGSADGVPAPDGAAGAGPAREAGDGSSSADSERGSRTYRIVTLGDVYTWGAGTLTPGADSWPAQMASILRRRGDFNISLQNLARKTSPSGDVIESQLAYVPDYEPDVVTLQVGVDDIVGGETESYARNIATILDELRAIVPSEHIFVVTTPDHTLTTWGRAYGPADIVDRLNDELTRAAEARGITVIDIGPVNERVAVDDSLMVHTTPPRPYPTVKQYAGWAELIGLYVYDALESLEP